MKKSVLFSLCATALSAAFVTGCATRQVVTEEQSRQDAMEANAAETRTVQNEVGAEPEITPVEPAPQESATAEQATTPKAVHPQPVAYTITEGDSISAIAVRFGVRTPDILALNPAVHANPNKLRIGQKVMLPPGTDISKKAKARPAKAQKAAPAKGATYTVKAGDVLGGIAHRHGVTVAELKKANNLKSDAIWVGQKLTIPAGGKKPTAQKKAPEQKPAAEKPAPKAKSAEPVAPAQEPLPPAPEALPEQEAPVAPEQAAPVEPGAQDALAPLPVQPEADNALTAKTTTHVVAEGEDLVSIALKFGVDASELRTVNGISADAGNAIPAGTTLKIPLH